MRMIYDYVLLKELKKEGKVLLPERSKEYPDMGEVVSVGPGDSYGYPEPRYTTVKPEDKVYFLRDRAFKVTLNKETFYIVKEREVFMVLEKGDIDG